MARTASKMLSLGTSLPTFNLLDTTKGVLMKKEDLSSTKPCLFMVICNHCPFVIYLHDALKEMVASFGSQIEFVAISSNDVVKFPQDGPMLMKELFKKLELNIPYLYDEEQVVAKAFDAACTPDFYLSTLKVSYTEDNLMILDLEMIHQ